MEKPLLNKKTVYREVPRPLEGLCPITPPEFVEAPCLRPNGIHRAKRGKIYLDLDHNILLNLILWFSTLVAKK